MRILSSLALLATAITSLTLSASAGAGAPEPGSLLVFPQFDNGRGGTTFITVDNTNQDSTPLPTGQLLAGTVDVEFVYINGDNCQEFNRTRRLTPNDSITVASFLDNPNMLRGYVYVFAKSPTNGQAISWNNLIGISRFYGASKTQDYDVNPYVFKALAAAGAPTDANTNGLRDLDGVEYEAAPDRILVPRFFGQEPPATISQLFLINLTGAAQFTAIVDFLIYNDNEEVFSAQYSFRCWSQVRLPDVSGAFNQSFLLSSNHNPAEQDLGHESGWYRMNGSVAYSTAASIQDPAILAMQVELVDFGQGGELPFVTGTQTNGDLVSHSIFN